MVEKPKTNYLVVQWFHPAGSPGREVRLLTVNPGTGPAIVETVFGTGATPGGIIILFSCCNSRLK